VDRDHDPTDSSRGSVAPRCVQVEVLVRVADRQRQQQQGLCACARLVAAAIQRR
jgi:hypothetical protein